MWRFGIQEFVPKSINDGQEQNHQAFQGDTNRYQSITYVAESDWELDLSFSDASDNELQ